MARSVRTISVNFTAGTAKFFTDVDRANAKIKEFGTGHVGEAKATHAAMKALEGQFFNNTRAAAKFLETIGGLGPLLVAAFPVIGALAFAGVLDDTAKKLYEFYKGIHEAPEKIAGSFRVQTDALRLTNDELAVANDRLTNEIAKLEGRHENTLKLALDEARTAADHLAESLDKDLTGLHKLLEEQNVSFWRQLFGEGGSKDITKEIGGESGFGGFRGRVAEISSEGIRQVREATTLREKEAAQTALNTRLMAAYGEEIGKVDRLIEEAKEKAKPETFRRMDQGGLGEVQTIPGLDERARLELLAGVRRQLQFEQAGVGLRATNTGLTEKKEGLEAARANAEMERPFENRMKLLNAQIEGLTAKLAAVGQPAAAQVLAKAFGAAALAIAETDKALERHNRHLTEGQKEQIRTAERTIAGTEAETEWQTKLAAAGVSIAGRIRSQELLTTAIGKGFEATRTASVEGRLVAELGQHYDDAAFRAAHLADVEKLRGEFGREFDAAHAQRAAEAVDRLGDQIEMERALAGAQAQGVEAVRQAGLAVKLRLMAAVGATKEQLAAEMELYNVSRGNVLAGEVAKITEKIGATERLTAAIAGGAEAVRKAALENRVAQIRRAGDLPLPGVLGIGQNELAERTAEAVAHQQGITAAAARPGNVYQDQLDLIGQEIQALEKVKAERGESLALEISLRDLENERLHVLAQESLQLRGLKDGVRAFFIEMQADAKSAAEIVYEALHGALDRVSSNMARLITGQKTDWAQAFRDLGTEMVQSTIKSVAQKGLGALGKVLGIDLGANKPDGTAANPLWVRMAGALPGGGALALPGIPGSGENPLGAAAGGALRAAEHGVVGFFQKLLGGFGGGHAGGSQAAAGGAEFGGFFADGGPVEPGIAYVVGERGRETFVPSSRGTIVPAGGLGGPVIHYNIDARGADLGAQNRIARGIEASHRMAVATAVQAGHERLKRVPGK